MLKLHYTNAEIYFGNRIALIVNKSTCSQPTSVYRFWIIDYRVETKLSTWIPVSFPHWYCSVHLIVFIHSRVAFCCLIWLDQSLQSSRKHFLPAIQKSKNSTNLPSLLVTLNTILAAFYRQDYNHDSIFQKFCGDITGFMCLCSMFYLVLASHRHALVSAAGQWVWDHLSQWQYFHLSQ